jgi:hypothetical protein
MLRFQNCGLVMVAALALAACQKSVPEERTEALNAQREADQTAREAANERSKEVAAANREAAKDITAAQREADEARQQAVTEEIAKTAEAQRTANAETREAIDATHKVQMDLRKSVEARLNKLDERVRDLNKEANDPKVAPAVATSAHTQLTAAEAEIRNLRTELPQLQTSPAPSVEQFRVRADQRVAQIEKALDQVDDQL